MYGLEFAYWQKTFKVLSSVDYKKDIKYSILFGLFWPIFVILEYRSVIKKFKITGIKFK